MDHHDVPALLSLIEEAFDALDSLATKTGLAEEWIATAQNYRDSFAKVHNVLSNMGLREGTAIASLSSREREAYSLLGKGLSTGEIGVLMGLSEKTVGTYQIRIRQKLGLTGKELRYQAVRQSMLREEVDAVKRAPRAKRG